MHAAFAQFMAIRTDAEHNKAIATKLTIPVLAVGGGNHSARWKRS